MDSSGKGIGIRKQAGTAASPATAFTGGSFIAGDTVELGLLINGSVTQQNFVSAATGATTAAEAATALAAVINAASGVAATASGVVITITPTTSVNLVDARSRRK